MNIIQKKWEFLYSTAAHVPPQAKKLYMFGLAALTTRSIASLRANARLLPLNWNTAKSKAYRLTTNNKLVPYFLKLLVHCALVRPDDTVAVDFSDFGNGMQVLLFAKQTGKGRATPLYFEVLRYPIPKDSQNLFVIAAIERFAAALGCKPMLVFDRGFACPSIIQFLNAQRYSFVIRIKGGKHMQARNGRIIAVRTMRRNDARMRAYGQSLRLVVSDRPKHGAEPWYLVTNNHSLSRTAIIDRYYHRFEIEEFFRDAKRLLGLAWMRCNTAHTLSVVLWFVLLGVWCLAHLESLLREHHENERKAMRLSRTRFLFERIQAACVFAAEGQYFNALCI